MAKVAPAEEAWRGLAGAQAMAKSIALAPDPRSRQVEISLARIRYEATPAGPAAAPRPTITIQYLRN